MDKPTDEEIRSKFLNFDELRKANTPPLPGATNEIPPAPHKNMTEEQKVIDLQLDVGRLIVSIVDLDRYIESQARMIGLLVKAVTHMDSKLREGKY